MAGKVGKSWFVERRRKKNEYINNLDMVLKEYAGTCVEELDISSSFEGQVRVLKMMTETGEFMRELSTQLDEIQSQLSIINKRLYEDNQKKLNIEIKEN